MAGDQLGVAAAAATASGTAGMHCNAYQPSPVLWRPTCSCLKQLDSAWQVAWLTPGQPCMRCQL